MLKRANNQQQQQRNRQRRDKSINEISIGLGIYIKRTTVMFYRMHMYLCANNKEYYTNVPGTQLWRQQSRKRERVRQKGTHK